MSKEERVITGSEVGLPVQDGKSQAGRQRHEVADNCVIQQASLLNIAHGIGAIIGNFPTPTYLAPFMLTVSPLVMDCTEPMQSASPAIFSSPIKW